MVWKFILGRMGLAAAAAFSVAGMTSSTNAATITYDLRAIQVTNGTLTNAKSVFPGLNSTVTLGLYALVANADGDRTNDGFLLTHTAIRSVEAADGAMGNLSAINYNSALIDTSVSLTGVPTNLDANPDLEVGGTDVESANGYITAGTGTATKFGTGSGAGPTEFFIGTVTWTYTGTGFFATELNFFLRQKLAGTGVSRQTVKYTSDGVAKLIAGDNSNSAAGDIAIAAPVVIGFPEPTSFGVIGLGATSLFARRNRRDTRAMTEI